MSVCVSLPEYQIPNEQKSRIELVIYSIKLDKCDHLFIMHSILSVTHCNWSHRRWKEMFYSTLDTHSPTVKSMKMCKIDHFQPIWTFWTEKCFYFNCSKQIRINFNIWLYQIKKQASIGVCGACEPMDWLPPIFPLNSFDRSVSTIMLTFSIQFCIKRDQ